MGCSWAVFLGLWVLPACFGQELKVEDDKYEVRGLGARESKIESGKLKVGRTNYGIRGLIFKVVDSAQYGPG